MKTIRSHSLALTILVMAAYNTSQAALISIPGLYNTGIDDSGGVLDVGTVDPHYLLSGPADVPYVQTIVFHPDGGQAWATPPVGSAWIGPDPTGSTYPIDPIGDYYYDLKITIDLKDLDPSKLQISGLWAADNSSRICVNGQATSFSKGSWGFTQLDSFLLQGMFVSGINTLDFMVNNEYGPSGLLVAGLQAADDGSLTMPNPPPSAVPEPSTYLAGLLLLIPFGFRWISSLPTRMKTR